jgi:hypothetical protein
MTTLSYYIGSALWMPAFFVVAGYRKPLGIVVLTVGFLAFAKVAFEMTLERRHPDRRPDDPRRAARSAAFLQAPGDPLLHLHRAA